MVEKVRLDNSGLKELLHELEYELKNNVEKEGVNLCEDQD